MNKTLEFVASVREKFGTSVARNLRRKGMVPAIIYGASKETLAVSIEEKEITKHYRKHGFISTVIQIKVGSKIHKVLPKSVELHPITDIVRHIDFVHLEKDTQRMEVPIIYEGKERAAGVKRGGFFNVIQRTITLLCEVNNIPKNVNIDVSAMCIGQSLKAKDMILPKGTQFASKEDSIIATIIGRKGGKSESEELLSTEIKAVK